MSRLTKLLGKQKEYVIAGEKFIFNPRTVNDIDLMIDMENETKRPAALKKLIRVTLKEAVPDATEEELDKISIDYLKEITEAILDVNGLGKA